jgi:hypothetical protein
MSELAAPTITQQLGHPFEVAVQIQTYAPKTFDLSEQLTITDVINPNAINLPTTADLVDDASLETLRKAWEAYILTPHSLDITHDNPDSETLVARAFAKIATEIGDAKLVFAIQHMRFPIPSDYTITLPQTEGLERQKIIESLVPFRNTSAMLQRMEQTLELPIATVRLLSQGINIPVSRMN